MDPYLQTILGEYASVWGSSQNKDLQLFQDLCRAQPSYHFRHDYPGHLTASIMIANTTFDRVLLTHHAKLNKWLQLGGHVDGERAIHLAGLREAQEESGLDKFEFVDLQKIFKEKRAFPNTDQPLVFDIDRHLIQAWKSEPEHYHYDIRFLLQADDHLPLTVSEESIDVRWFDLDAARAITDEASMHRQFDKLARVRAELNHTPV